MQLHPLYRRTVCAVIKTYRVTNSITRKISTVVIEYMLNLSIWSCLINVKTTSIFKFKFIFRFCTSDFDQKHYICRSLCNKFLIYKHIFYKVTFRTAEICEVIKKAIYLSGVAPTHVQTTSDAQAIYWSVLITNCHHYIML